MFAVIGKGGDWGTLQKGCVIPAYREHRSRAFVHHLYKGEVPFSRRSHPQPTQATVQRAGLGLDFPCLLVSEADPAQPSLENEV